jgi:lysophospholipase L1-like esterase
MKKAYCFLVALLLSCMALQAQQPAFYEEIQAYKKQDSAQMPPRNAILFIGSSSFNFWKDMQQYFPDHAVINRGFGGSSLPDVIRYADDIIYPYQPKQVVIYCGENDIATLNSTPQDVLTRLKTLVGMIRNKFKDIPIVYVSIKPSPSRAHLMPVMVSANRMIKEYLKKQKKAVYVDVYSKMLLPDGKPNPEIFVNDNLHMNAKGYAIWKQAIEPTLLK